MFVGSRPVTPDTTDAHYQVIRDGGSTLPKRLDPRLALQAATEGRVFSGDVPGSAAAVSSFLGDCLAFSSVRVLGFHDSPPVSCQPQLPPDRVFAPVTSARILA
jgi:hypothetical protein